MGHLGSSTRSRPDRTGAPEAQRLFETAGNEALRDWLLYLLSGAGNSRGFPQRNEGFRFCRVNGGMNPMELDETTRTKLEAAAFRRIVRHLQERTAEHEVG